MSGLAARYYNGDNKRKGAQTELLRDLGGYSQPMKVAGEYLDSGKWVLFGDELFAGMAKMALRLSPRDDRVVPADFGYRIVECALMYNELLASESLPKETKNTVEDILAAELRSLVRNREHPYSIVGRYVKFIAWLRSETATRKGWSRSIDADFDEFFGFSIEDYLAAAALFAARYGAIRNADGMRTFDPIINAPEWFQHLEDHGFTDQFIALFGIPAADLIAAWKALKSTSLSSGALGPLWSRPLIRLDDPYVVAPLPPLIYNAMGEGLYYNILDRYQKPQKDEFSRMFGYFFEDYVREIFEAAYAGLEGCVVRGDEPYGRNGGARTTDTVIFERDDVIFVEVVAKRVNLESVIRDLDPLAIAGALEKGIKKKLKQLDTNVKAYREGRTFADRPRPNDQRIFAIIATVAPYPHSYIISKYIPDTLQQNGWLDGIASIEIADIEEIEMLEDGIPDGLALGDFLAKKAVTAPNMPLKNVLLQIAKGAQGLPAIERGAQQIALAGERLRL